MENLNDSGYGSPQARCPNDNKEEKIQLHVLKGSNSEIAIATSNDLLADVLKLKYPKMKMKKTLIWAEIRGQQGTKCVNQFTLPCGLIQPDTNIEMQEVDKIVIDYIEKLGNTKAYSKPLGKPFFISIRDRRRKAVLTNISYQELRHDDICVVARHGQMYYDALVKDSRFKNVDRFTLQPKGKIDVVNIYDRPCDFKDEYVFEVQVKRSSRVSSVKPSPVSMNSDNSPSTSAAELPTTERLRIPKKVDLKKLADKLIEEDVVYVFSKNIEKLSTEEVRNEMDNCLRARAQATLVGPRDRIGDKYIRSIKKIAEVEFANYRVKARPISLSKTLCPLYDSIGCLECGSVQATCFFISSDIIATNWHVVDKIQKARRSSTHVNHKDVFVYFHYEKCGEKSFRCQLMPLRSEENIMSEQFDYAFLHLQQPRLCSKLNELGEQVRCKVPDFGNTCIVAHPNGEEKQEELVPILPLHENRRSLELKRRLAEKEQECIEDPSECMLTHSGSECIHMYNSNILELYGNKSLMTYDVGSMFEGSSGAPVFDMNGYIVALHTRGFRLEGSSVVEVGTTFKAIINDLEARNLHDFVQKNFPSCWEENMDEDL